MIIKNILNLGKLVGVAILFLMSFVFVFSATFDWNPVPTTYVNLVEGETFSYDANITVSEGVVNFIFLDSGLNDLNGTFKNTATGFFEFTPSDKDVEDYWGSQYLFQVEVRNKTSILDKIEHDFLFTILNVNDVPIINYTSPSFESSIKELESINFRADAYDIDPTNDNLSFFWFFDGVLNKSEQFNGISNYEVQQGSFVYVADYDSSGVHNVSVVVNDSFGGSVSYGWELTVSNENRYPSIDWYFPNVSFIEINETESILFKVNVSDEDLLDVLSVFWFLDGELVFQHDDTNVSSWSYVSDFSSAGFHNVTVVVNDSDSVVSNFWNVSVLNVNLAPNITFFNDSGKGFVEESQDINLSFEFFDFDGNLDWYELRRNGTLVDSGVPVNNVSIDFMWSTVFGDGGVYNFSLFVNDSEGLNASNFTIVEVINNGAPVIDEFVSIVSVLENSTVDFYFNASDVNGNIDGFGVFLDGVVMNLTNFSSIYFNFSFAGEHNLTYFVNDTGGLNDLESFLFDVVNVNLPPEILSVEYNFSINEGEVLNISFLYDDFDKNFDFVGIYRDSILVNNSNSFVWETNFSDAGVYNFSLFVNDTGGLEDNVSFLVSVVDNVAPIIVDFVNYSSRNEGEVLNFNFSFLDVNGNVDVVKIFLNGSLLNVSNVGSFYFDEVSAGDYNLTYFVNDTQGFFDVETVLFTINQTNFAPKINLSSIVVNSPVNEGENLTIFFNATDVDLNIDEFAIFYEGEIVSSNNSFVWETNFTDEGAHNFILFVNDSDGLNDSYGIFVSVIDNVAPSIVSFINVSSVMEDSNVFFGFDAEDLNDNLGSFVIYKDGVMIEGNSSSIYFDKNSEGVHNITYFVNDSEGLSDFVTIFVNVSNVNEAPDIVAYDYNFSVHEGEVFSINFTAEDIDGNIEDYAIYRNGSLVNLSSEFVWGTSFSDSGLYNFSLFVNDSFGESDSVSFLVEVFDNGAPVIGEFVNFTNVSEGQSYLFNFSASDLNDNIFIYSIFLDGVLVEMNFSSLIYFNFTSAGVHNVTYFVSDLEGLNDSLNVSFVVEDVNFVPDVDFSKVGVFNVSEDGSKLVVLDDYVFDEDDEDSSLNWSCFIVGNSSDIVLSLNSSVRVLNVSVFNDFVGVKNLSCGVSDLSLASDYDNLIVNVLEGNNDAPIFESFFPSNLSLFANETDVLNFSVVASDVEGMAMSYEWFLDSKVVGNLSNVSVYFDFFTAGLRNVSVLVVDEGGANSSMFWMVNVSNVNRKSFYGRSKNLFNLPSFPAGQDLNVNVSNSSLFLDGGSFMNGSYVSKVVSESLIDFKVSFDWVEFGSNETDVDIFFRSGPTVSVGSSWTDWIGVDSNNFSSVYELEGSNFQYRIDLRTLSSLVSPEVYNLSVKYFVADKEMNRDTSIYNWIDLDDYFYDLDVDDDLKFYVSNSSNIDFTVNEQNYLSVFPKPGFYGVEEVEFFVDDGYLNVSSGNVTFTINNVDNSQSEGSSSSGGGGGSRTRTKEVVVEKPVVVPKDSIELDLPKPMKVGNKSIMVPIKIKNIFNQSLENVSLILGKSDSVINLSFESLVIDLLLPGEVFETMVEVSNFEDVKEFYLNVTVEQDVYGFRDTGKIYLESLKDKVTAYEEINTKLLYAQEFLTENNNCLELKEHIFRARNLLEEKNYDEALQIIEKTIGGCKAILLNEKEFDYESVVLNDDERREEFEYYFKNSVYLLFLLLLYPIFTTIRSHFRRHVHNKSKIHSDLNDYLDSLDDE